MRIAASFMLAVTPFLLIAAGGGSEEDASCQSPFHVMHVDVRHTESKGVGYQDGYTTLEAFGIYQHNPNFMPFLDLRGHVFNNGKLAGNIGLGERSVISSINHVLGSYIYYDVRQDKHDFTVNQIGPGIELLGRRMEYRINAYFPVGSTKSSSSQPKFHRFNCRANQILLRSKRKFALWGIDSEVGAHLTQSSRHDFYYGMGPYYFNGDSETFWGGKARLYWRYKEYVTLEAYYSYDHVFKNIVQGTLTFSYPFGNKLKRIGRNCPNPNDLALSRAAFTPYRFEIPVTVTGKQTRPAINPVTGQPLRILFVDNTGASGCQGAFTTLAQAQNAARPFDIIYVFPGNGTTQGMNAGIVLQNDQKLFGSGTPQLINTRQGNIRIPAHSAIAPTITNTGDVVTLANNNEVSGLMIQVPGANVGISGVSGITNVNIHDNVIQTNFSGIALDAAGTISVSNNVITGTNATFSDGISVTVINDRPTVLSIVNNRIATVETGIFVQPAAIIDNPPFTNAFITNNTISGFAENGILISNGIANSIFRIVDNSILDTSSLGGSTFGGISLKLGNPNDSGNFLISNNTVLTTTPAEFVNSISINTVNNTPTIAQVIITDNVVLAGPGLGSSGVNVNANLNGTLNTLILNNQVRTALPFTNGINIAGNNGIVNVAGLPQVAAPRVTTSGNVNVVRLPPNLFDIFRLR